MLHFFMEHSSYILRGVPVAFEIWGVAMVAGFALGMLLAAARLFGGPVVFGLATGYIEAFRGTPMIVQLFIVYLGLPAIGLTFSRFTAIAIAMTLNTAAYQAEYFRGSIRSVGQGQIAAARALGMSGTQTFFSVILPQALRRVAPQWSNEAVLEFKFTSIAYTIGLAEITARASEVGSETFKYFWAFLIAGVIYLVLTAVMVEVLEWVQRHFSIPGITLSGKAGRLSVL